MEQSPCSFENFLSAAPGIQESRGIYVATEQSNWPQPYDHPIVVQSAEQPQRLSRGIAQADHVLHLLPGGIVVAALVTDDRQLQQRLPVLG